MVLAERDTESRSALKTRRGVSVHGKARVMQARILDCGYLGRALWNRAAYLGHNVVVVVDSTRPILPT